MYTLYIDTHDKELVFVLFRDNEVLAQKRRVSEKHSKYAISLLDEILKDNKITIDDVGEIIVVNGPGSFTGVRIGCVIAKVISYTKKIPVKAISYLQAEALSYEGEVIVGIADKNGVYGGKFDREHKLLGDYFYLSKEEYKNYKEKIIIEGKIDLNKVYLYMKDKDSINPHVLKPIYVKRLEVENG